MKNYIVANGELYHYGVLGMKWGVRRYQNKDGTLKKHDRIVLKKGSEVQRISKSTSETNKGRTYVSFTELDNLKYECDAGTDGLYWTANYNPNKPGDPNYNNRGFKIKLKVTNDIIAPSYNETVDAFIKTVSNKPIKQLVEEIYGRKEDKKYSKKEYKKKTKEFIKAMKHLTVEEARDKAYLAYSQSLMTSEKNQKEFFGELKKRGYNAVVDHNDARSGYVDAPLIVFERSNNLKQVSATAITERDQERAEYRLSKLKK